MLNLVYKVSSERDLHTQEQELVDRDSAFGRYD